MTKTINPADLQPNEFYRYMIGTIGPRPIAFASTIDSLGTSNLSPFSFFNVFGYNPHTLVFSPTINRHGHKKHTLLNLEEVGEVVINVVNYAMVEQISLASAEFDRGVNEFEKAGFTAIASDRVRPPRVAESPAAFECIVRQIIPTGDPARGWYADYLRRGYGSFSRYNFQRNRCYRSASTRSCWPYGWADWYCRAQGDALFEVARPKVGIGVDQIPASIRNSAILSGNDLGKLGSFARCPRPMRLRISGLPVS